MTPKSQLEPLPDPLDSNIPPAEFQPVSVAVLPPSPRKLPIPEQQPTPQAASALRTPRSKSRTLPSQDGLSQQTPQPQTPPRKKLSKNHSHDASSIHSFTNGSTTTLPGTPDGQHKVRSRSSHRTPVKIRPTTPITSPQALPTAEEPPVQLDEETIKNAGIPLDDDPFARVEGVKMLNPVTPALPTPKETVKGHKRSKSSKEAARESVYEDAVDTQFADAQKGNGDSMSVPPVSAEERRKSRKERRAKEKEKEKSPPPMESTIIQDETPAEPITMVQLLSEAPILTCLLEFFSFYDWCLLLGLSKEVRTTLVRTSPLREAVLERFLKTVGYSRWIWDDKEPLSLSLQVCIIRSVNRSVDNHQHRI